LVEKIKNKALYSSLLKNTINQLKFHNPIGYYLNDFKFGKRKSEELKKGKRRKNH